MTSLPRDTYKFFNKKVIKDKLDGKFRSYFASLEDATVTDSGKPIELLLAVKFYYKQGEKFFPVNGIYSERFKVSVENEFYSFKTDKDGVINFSFEDHFIDEVSDAMLNPLHIYYQLSLGSLSPDNPPFNYETYTPDFPKSVSNRLNDAIGFASSVIYDTIVDVEENLSFSGLIDSIYDKSQELTFSNSIVLSIDQSSGTREYPGIVDVTLTKDKPYITMEDLTSKLAEKDVYNRNYNPGLTSAVTVNHSIETEQAPSAIFMAPVTYHIFMDLDLRWKLINPDSLVYYYHRDVIPVGADVAEKANYDAIKLIAKNSSPKDRYDIMIDGSRRTTVNSINYYHAALYKDPDEGNNIKLLCKRAVTYKS